MKKLIALLTSLALCAATLAACGAKDDAAETSARAEVAVELDTDVVKIDISDDEQKTSEDEKVEDEGQNPAESSAACANPVALEFGVKGNLSAVADHDFSDYTVSHTVIKGDDSMFKAFFDTLNAEKGFYIAGDFSDIEAVEVYMAFRGEEMAIKALEEGVESLVYLKDGIVTMYTPSEMVAIKIALPMEMLAGMLGMDDMMANFNLIDMQSASIDEVHVFEIEAGGQKFIYEYVSEGTGFVFDECGCMVKMITPEGNIDVYAFTSDIPAKAFEQPSGYEIMDLTILGDIDLSQLGEFDLGDLF